MDYEQSLFDDDLTVIPVDAVAACAAAFAEVGALAEAEEERDLQIALGEPVAGAERQPRTQEFHLGMILRVFDIRSRRRPPSRAKGAVNAQERAAPSRNIHV